MNEDRWLSLNEICEYLGIGRDTALSWVKNKGMPSCKVGKFWRFKKIDVDEWVRTFESSNIKQDASSNPKSGNLMVSEK